MDFDDYGDLVKEYLEDSLEFVDELEALFLQLEQNLEDEPDQEVLREILSQLHTFKGNSGMMGFSNLQKYTHKLEDLFKSVQTAEVEMEEAAVELIMQSATNIRNALSAINLDNPKDPSLVSEIKAVDQFVKDRSKLGESVKEGTVAASREIANPFSRKTDVIKVDFKRLDDLLNLMGEMVIHRTRLGRIDAEIKELLGEKGVSLDLSDTVEQMGKVSTELHESIMKVRMLPIKQVFMRFPRFVRDLAHEKGKEIDIQFQGEDTELDKTVIDEIGEPLSHLIRNAIDHGIESPEERRKSGKPEQGTLMISAYQESSHIIITVEDDGRGIDEKRIMEKARGSGLVDAETLGHRELIDLIFLPGLSTAEKVSEISGRGIGMDVVQKSLSKINGSVEVETEPGVGTRFIIKLPLTLAIISALMVEVSGEQYAIPLASVVESIKVDGKEIHEVNHRKVAKVRERILPLVYLHDLFGLQHTVNGNKDYVVIVQSTVGQVGIIVDSLLGRQEIVIKALDEYTGESKSIAGATILGDGKVVLILDVPSLTERAALHGDGEAKREAGNA